MNYKFRIPRLSTLALFASLVLQAFDWATHDAYPIVVATANLLFMVWLAAAVVRVGQRFRRSHRPGTGDPELPDVEARHVDIANTRINAMARLDNEFLIQLVGGVGEMRDATTGQMHAVFSGVSIDLTCMVGDTSNPQITRPDVVESTVSRWREKDTPLRLVAAPDHGTWIIADDTTFVRLPLPRNPR